MSSTGSEPTKSPLREIIQPFIDLVHAPRALWGINLAHVIEGMVYFGMLNYLHMYFNEYVHLNDVWANRMVGVLTAGITIAMFFLGFVADKKGVRFAIILAFCLMLIGRLTLAAGPTVGLEAGEAKLAAAPPDPELVTSAPEASAQAATPAASQPASQPAGQAAVGTASTQNIGMGSTLHLAAMVGIVFVLLGYGMYQPGAYAAIRQFTTEKTASMGFAMIYALMNLGIVLTAGFGLVRNAIGISGAYWVFCGFTTVALLCTFFILSKKTVEQAIARVKAENEEIKRARAADPQAPEGTAPPAQAETTERVPAHLWVSMAMLVACVYFIPPPWRSWIWGVIAGVAVVFLVLLPQARVRILAWLAAHPLANTKFFFFIFCLIPVQTLFAHNWLTMPMYMERAYAEGWPWISRYFEIALAVNPLLVFIFVPIVTAVTQKAKVYNMMILGTAVMGAPTFLLALGPSPWTLFPYILIMTLGESMWQPRFLQYAAEIAPEGRTGVYMGVAQFPWFLTKMIVPLYAGIFLSRFCPQTGVINTEPMWLIYGGIAMTSTVLLLLARGWLGKDFKTKAD